MLINYGPTRLIKDMATIGRQQEISKLFIEVLGQVDVRAHPRRDMQEVLMGELKKYTTFVTT